MTRLRGRARWGERLKASAPFGKWITQTFIAALRCGELTAPWIIPGAMDRAAFNTYAETGLDNLSVHRSAYAEGIIRARGAGLLFLPQYAPRLNPVEQAFSKLKADLRAAAARTFEDLAAAIGSICKLYDPTECRNYVKVAGYAAD
ncbi:MAG: transposase [Hyphomonas sp.]|uniref:transposase n=1 Tax=Hyphomonas sp. TaxID=87 RepID=UPI0034A05116